MSIAQELENSIDIVELVSKYTKLKKVGANYKSLCPFPWHNEKTPSFVVSPAKQLGYCFGCHRWGWPLKFIMDIENCSFKEALEILANITGRTDLNLHVSQKEIEKERNIFSLHKDISSYYEGALKNNPEATSYLEKRGIGAKERSDFLFWFADSGHRLLASLREKNYKDSDIEESKVFLDIKKAKDKFLGRIIFPIQNIRGDIVAFAGRIIGSWEPKYLNSPATKIYDKSAILYGLYQAKKEIIEKDFVIICEGYMDVISLHKAGYKNTVCVSGTALTEKQVDILKRLTHKFYLCFDNDGAWEKATRASIETLKNKGIEVHIIILEWGKDPDEILEKNSDFEALIKKALSPVWFFLQKEKGNTGSIEDKKKMLRLMLDSLKNYQDNVEKDFYIKEIAERLDINIKIVYDTFNRIRFQKNTSENYEKISFSSEDILIAHLLSYPEVWKNLKEKIVFFEETSPFFQEIIKNPKNIDSLELSKKELLRWLALQIEEKMKTTNKESLKESKEKVIAKINSDIFKKESKKLREALEKDKSDIESLQKYNELLLKAKKYKIKT